jgi:triphosphoribosyl-dephospho-CoA synthase
MTRPGGLGKLDEHDVAAPPTLTLRQAMAQAADRDRIAALYTSDYGELVHIGLPAWRADLATGRDAALRRVYLELLAVAPDTHIVRKHGAPLAHSVMNAARSWRDRARAGLSFDVDPVRGAWARWDEALKQARINPGTCADLSVGTALLADLSAPAST